MTDPVWFFITDWFPLYLAAKGIPPKNAAFTFWIPFVAADLGNFFGGWSSGFLIERGWALGAARKALVVFGGLGVTLLIPTILTANLAAITGLFAAATFCYAAFSTIANTLPSDLFTGGAVASVSGFSGTGAGIGTIVATFLIGYYSDAARTLPGHSFDKVVVVAGLVPFVGMLLVLALVRNSRATERRLVRPI
jgi:ACS family hexuronate transporter-like MFS transporter